MLFIFLFIFEKNIKDRNYFVQTEMSLVIIQNISCLYRKGKIVALNRSMGLLKYPSITLGSVLSVTKSL